MLERGILEAMSARVHAVHYAWREYLTLEGASNIKHEYLDGQIWLIRLSGGSDRGIGRHSGTARPS